MIKSLDVQQEVYSQEVEVSQDGKITVTYRQVVWLLVGVFLVSNLFISGIVGLAIGMHYQKRLIVKETELTGANDKLRVLKELEDEIFKRLPKKKKDDNVKPNPTSAKRNLAKKLALVIVFEYSYRSELRLLQISEIVNIINTESGFDVMAVSEAGAEGLMQLMPLTARDWGVRDSFDPEDNMKGGLRYLAHLLRRYKNKEIALMAYYTGEKNMNKYLRRGYIPAQLVEYVGKIVL